MMYTPLIFRNFFFSKILSCLDIMLRFITFGYFRFGTVLATIILGCLTRSVYGSPTTVFQALTTDYWDWRLKDAPEFASSVGVNTYNDKVESYSLQILEDRKAKVDEYLRQLNLIDKTQLDKSYRVSYDVLKDTLHTFVDGYKWQFYGPMNPVNFLEGMWTDPESNAIYGKFETKKDFEDFISRLEGWSKQVPDMIIRMNVAMNRSTSNNWVSEGSQLLDQFGKLDVDPEQFVLYKPFNGTLDNMTITEGQKKTLRRDAKEAIGKLLDSYRHLRNFTEQDYRTNSRQAWGVNSFKDGEEYYKACLKWHLSVDMTPEEVHEKGLQEVDRIYKKMKTIMDRLSFHGTISEFFAKLKNNSSFIIDDPDATIERFREIIFERINPKLPKYFKNIPDRPVRIEKMPYDGPGGQYIAGSPDGSRPGVFQANVIRPADNPTFDMVALSLHEANPGHHLQIIDKVLSVAWDTHSISNKTDIGNTNTPEIYSQSSAGLDDYRKAVDYTKYFSVPFHFPFYTAYSEGWALYSEALGEKDELDIYKDDYELMGRYSSEIFRACRLVVDTGLHHYNWSRERAIEYMVNYTSFSRESLTIEIDRYITWPGQACAYKIGELKIWELRRRAESFLGDLFDIQGFHSVILENGAVPLNVLEELIVEWIHETHTAQTKKFFKMVTDNYWAWRQLEEPELATAVNNYKYNDRLESFSYSVFRERLVQAYTFLGQLIDMDNSKLSLKESISYDVLKNMLNTYTDGFSWINYGTLSPFNFLEGFLRNPSSLIMRTPFDTQGDFVNFIRRIELLPKQFTEMTELSRMAISLGHTYNNVSVSRVPLEIDNIIVDDPTKFIMYQPFKQKGAEVFGDEKPSAEARLKTAIQNFISKLKELKTFIIEEYMPSTRKGLGIGHLNNGTEYYKACLKWHTSLDITPEEVHQKGLDEVGRISKEIKTTMGRLNFPQNTTIKQAYAAMANDSKFFIQGGEETINRYTQIIFDRIKPKLPQYFKNLPDLPLVVWPAPTDGIRGSYSSGSEDGSRPGVFYINVRRSKDNPTYGMVSLSLHEAIPGHHLQHSYDMTSELPEFRKYNSWKGYSIPFYFPLFSSYSEGWALYSEYLGEEMGIYEDDYEMMGRYSGEMWRACRLVIDTGIHYYNWTREQSIDYLLQYTAVTRSMAEIEIDRYATWPGQACAYKMGEMKIKELRKQAETTLGDLFDIRDFHHAILSNGPVPLDVLEKIVNNWITSVNEGQISGQPTCQPVPAVSSSNTIQVKTMWIWSVILIFSTCLEHF